MAAWAPACRSPQLWGSRANSRCSEDVVLAGPVARNAWRLPRSPSSVSFIQAAHCGHVHIAELTGEGAGKKERSEAGEILNVLEQDKTH